MNAVKTRSPSSQLKPQIWSDKAETLATYGSINSATWKLGILAELNNDTLNNQIIMLAQKSDSPNPFFNLAFLSASSQNLGQNTVQYLFLSEKIGEQETLKMFAPVVLKKQGIFRRPVLKVWTHLYAPLGVPLIDAEDHACFDALIECLKSARHKTAKALLFDLLPKQSSFIQKLYISNSLCDTLYRFSYSTRAMLKPGSSGDYSMTNLSGKRKQRLKRGLKELNRFGDYRFEKVTSPKAVMACFEEFLVLEAKSWKGKRGTSLKNLKSTSAFAREAVQNMVNKDQCTIYTLRLNDEAIAALVVFSENNYFFPWKIAFDETYAKCSPGNNLLVHVNQELYKLPGFQGMDSLAAEDNKTAKIFWPDEQELYSMAIGIGKNAERNATLLAREVYLKKRLKNAAKQVLSIFS